MKTLFLFLGGLAFVQFDVIRNLRMILAKNRKPNYTESTILRLVVGSILAFIRHRFDLLAVLSLLFAFASWFWLLFDPLLNYGRALAWKYLGMNAETDKILRKLDWQIAMMIKIGLVAISSTIYLIFFAGL